MCPKLLRCIAFIESSCACIVNALLCQTGSPSILFFAQGLVYSVTDRYTYILFCVQCTSFSPLTPNIFVMLSFWMCNAWANCRVIILYDNSWLSHPPYVWAISWVGYIHIMNELTASGNLQLSDKIMTLYFIGVLCLLNIVLTYSHGMLLRCLVIIATVAAFMTSGICSEDICTTCDFRLHIVWIMLHKQYTY